MGKSNRYAVQFYRRVGGGQYIPYDAIHCRTSDEARLRARKSCENKNDRGAAIILLSGDDFLDQTEEPIVFEVYGCCPPELVDRRHF